VTTSEVFFSYEIPYRDGVRLTRAFDVPVDSAVLLISEAGGVTPFGEGPRFLIGDNDRKYGLSFDRVTAGIDVLKTPYKAPKANAICERFLGSLRRECLDYILILSERHLYRVVKEYKQYFNHARPHQGIEQRIPCGPAHPDRPPVDGEITSRPVLGGLHHEYRWQIPKSPCYH
jgi:putative transposase